MLLKEFMTMLRSARYSTDNNKVMIVGLGNPGNKYINTRHNVGFEMLDSVASYYDIKIKKIKSKGLIGEGKIVGKSVVLVKPQTYMNLSGECVGALASFYKISPENVIVIYDDISLDIAKIRIRSKGSSGGHNGMKSIISHLKSEDFIRIRVGIGSPEGDLSDYVLQNFSKNETQELIEIAKLMPDIIECIFNEGVMKAMNKYN